MSTNMKFLVAVILGILFALVTIELFPPLGMFMVSVLCVVLYLWLVNYKEDENL